MSLRELSTASNICGFYTYRRPGRGNKKRPAPVSAAAGTSRGRLTTKYRLYIPRYAWTETGHVGRVKFSVWNEWDWYGKSQANGRSGLAGQALAKDAR